MNYQPGLMPSVFGDVTGAKMVMPCTIMLLHSIETCVITLEVKDS